MTPHEDGVGWMDLVTDGGDGPRFGQERHRILRELRRELERHPAVDHAKGVPDETFRELRATLDPAVLGAAAETAILRVVWIPAPDDAEFVVHYSDGGFDCGFHREPNPHADGKTHYQRRDSPGEAYDYEPASFDAETPPRILRAVLDRLASRPG